MRQNETFPKQEFFKYLFIQFKLLWKDTSIRNYCVNSHFFISTRIISITALQTFFPLLFHLHILPHCTSKWKWKTQSKKKITKQKLSYCTQSALLPACKHWSSFYQKVNCSDRLLSINSKSNCRNVVCPILPKMWFT